MQESGRVKTICGLMSLKMRHSGGLCGTINNGLQFALISSLQKPVMELPFWFSFFMNLNSAGVALSANHKTEIIWILQTRASSFVCLMFPTSQVLYHFYTTVQDWVIIQRDKARWYLWHSFLFLYRTAGGTVTKHVTLRASKVIHAKVHLACQSNGKTRHNFLMVSSP